MKSKIPIAKAKYVKIYAHDDLDGLVSALLLSEVFGIEDIEFVSPQKMKEIKINGNEIIADLGIFTDAGLCFDHHYIRNLPKNFNGKYDPHSPSCAEMIFKHYYGEYKNNIEKYEWMLEEVSRMDCAGFTRDECIMPNGWHLLHLTLGPLEFSNEDYFKHVLSLLKNSRSIEQIMADEQVKEIANKLRLIRFNIFESLVNIKNGILLMDLREFEILPKGIQFFFFALDERIKSIIQVRKLPEPKMCDISAGHSIFLGHARSTYHIGGFMEMYLKGGGHFVVGGAKVKEQDLNEIINCLKARLILHRFFENLFGLNQKEYRSNEWLKMVSWLNSLTNNVEKMVFLDKHFSCLFPNSNSPNMFDTIMNAGNFLGNFFGFQKKSGNDYELKTAGSIKIGDDRVLSECELLEKGKKHGNWLFVHKGNEIIAALSFLVGEKIEILELIFGKDAENNTEKKLEKILISNLLLMVKRHNDGLTNVGCKKCLKVVFHKRFGKTKLVQARQ